MTTGENSLPEPGPDASVDDIQADIEATRKQLGDTVEALAAKADVKAHAKQKATKIKDRVEPMVPTAALVAAGLLVIGIVIWRRRR